MARSTHRWARIARTSKMLVGWLPVGHNWRHHGAVSDKCPCCGLPDETFEHLFRCGAQVLVEARRTMLTEMARVASVEKLPSQVTTLAFFILRKIQTHDDPTPTLPTVLDRIWKSQRRLGLDRFATGYVTQEWSTAMEVFGSKDPTGDVAKLITIIWEGWCEPIWAIRNNILKRQANPTDVAESRKVKDRILWFKSHAHEALPRRYHFLIEFDPGDLKYWSRKTCRNHLKHLELGYRIYKVECRQRASGQMVITDWLQCGNSNLE